MKRLIPCLLLNGDGLYKGVGFKNHKYIGDPFNAVRIFNGFEVDELMILDISASKNGRTISSEFVSQIASECFIPLTVGGGITSVEQAKILLQSGAEKVVINSAAYDNPDLISRLAGAFGSQSVVVSVDASKRLLGSYALYSHSGTKKRAVSLENWMSNIQALGAGEILLTSIDREGSLKGPDLDLYRRVSECLSIPVIANGGVGSLDDVKLLLRANISAVSAGALFVFHGQRKAVLISYPERQTLDMAMTVTEATNCA